MSQPAPDPAMAAWIRNGLALEQRARDASQRHDAARRALDAEDTPTTRAAWIAAGNEVAELGQKLAVIDVEAWLMGVLPPRLRYPGTDPQDKLRAALEIHHLIAHKIAMQPAIPRYTWRRPYINPERIYQRTGPCATCGAITFDAYLTCYGEPRDSAGDTWTPYCRAHAPPLGLVDGPPTVG